LEVDWLVGYYPPPENFQASLEKILKGENTFKVLQEAYAKNPKDVAAVFGIGRKWADRYDTAKAEDKFKEVIALDPQGKAGAYTDPETHIAAPFTDFARFELAAASFQTRKPDPAPLKAFIDAYPASPLAREVYLYLSSYYGSAAPKEDAGKFFAEFAGRYPGDPEPLVFWLRRIIRDRGPLDKGLELAAKLGEITRRNPNPNLNQTMARVYDLAGDKAKAEEVYGKTFMDGRVQSLAYNLISYANYWSGKKENLESAKAMVDTAVKIGPDSVYFLRDVADAYIRLGEDAKAMAAYGPAWLEKSESGLTGRDINTYASFWLRQEKNLESALEAARKSVEIDPKSYYFWSTLSDVYAKMGDKTEAVKAGEKALELAPANAKVALQKRIDGLKGPAPEKK
jgi:tetratricopeptide (TPR) repeat protein